MHVFESLQMLETAQPPIFPQQHHLLKSHRNTIVLH